MQKFDAQGGDISLYLTLFEMPAKVADIKEEHGVSQLISLLPSELAQIIVKELEEGMNDYASIKSILLDRLQMKLETFRLKFTQHQRKTGALWKELVFELGNYLEGWLDGLLIQDSNSLKNLMIADQLKRQEEHFLDEWGELVDPIV